MEGTPSCPQKNPSIDPDGQKSKPGTTQNADRKKKTKKLEPQLKSPFFPRITPYGCHHVPTTHMSYSGGSPVAITPSNLQQFRVPVHCWTPISLKRPRFRSLPFGYLDAMSATNHEEHLDLGKGQPFDGLCFSQADPTGFLQNWETENWGGQQLGSPKLGSQKLGGQKLGSQKLGSQKLRSQKTGEAKACTSKLERPVPSPFRLPGASLAKTSKEQIGHPTRDWNAIGFHEAFQPGLSSDPLLKVTNFYWVKWKSPPNTKRPESYG